MEINRFKIKSCSDTGTLKHLAVFIYLKSIHVNSCIYNYTEHGLADKTTMSRSAVRKYVKHFLDSGWCVMRGRHLFFNKLKTIDKHKNRAVISVKGITIKEIINEFYLHLLKHKQAQFNRLVELERDVNKPSGLKSHKRAIKIVKKLGINVNNLPHANAKLQISIKKIAQWLKCSVGKASGIISSLHKKGLITVIRCRNIVGRTNNFELAKAIVGVGKNRYYNNGMVIEVSCSYYVF